MTDYFTNVKKSQMVPILPVTVGAAGIAFLLWQIRKDGYMPVAEKDCVQPNCSDNDIKLLAQYAMWFFGIAALAGAATYMTREKEVVAVVNP